MSVERPFDIIIDDGSHISLDIVETFLLHWRHLRPGGLYVIEDLRPTYDDWVWPHFPHYPNEHFRRSHFLAMLDDLMKEIDLRDRREVQSFRSSGSRTSRVRNRQQDSSAYCLELFCR